MSYHVNILNITFLINTAQHKIRKCNNIKKLELMKTYWIGKSGFFSKKNIILNKLIPYSNIIKNNIIKYAHLKIRNIYLEKKEKLENKKIRSKILKDKIDVSLPGKKSELGTLHPISKIILYAENFFQSLGFSIILGNEIESSFYNFDALNIPKNHPSRTKNDTFWIDKNCLLRTQTSSVQIRVMQSQNPPLRIISSGRVYRNDHDKTHTPMFHQMEGLIIDYDVNLSNLKSILYSFCYYLLGESIKIRFRPAYFPFTQPSAEIDIMNQYGKWIEILGCGLVHPHVLNNININSNKYSGLAFGIGIERLAMLYYKLSDVRLLFMNNLSFLKQFK